MNSFFYLSARESSNRHLIERGAERLRHAIAEAAPASIITVSNQVIRPLHGVLEPTPGRIIEAITSRHHTCLFVYENEFHDRRLANAGDIVPHRTVSAEIIDFCGPSVANTLPRTTAQQRHMADFTKYSERCKTAFIVGFYQPGMGIVDDPKIRPGAFRLNREFTGFVAAITAPALASPVRPPDLRNTQFYCPIESLAHIQTFK